MSVLTLPMDAAMWWFRTMSESVAVAVLMTASLCQLLWQHLRPLLAPLLDILDTIDPDDVNVATITGQFVKSMVMAMMLWWKAVTSVVLVLTRPFEELLTKMWKYFEDLKEEYLDASGSK